MPSDAHTAKAGDSHDLIVAGGGIHGTVLALMAAERGLRTLLLDRGQPGQATSAAWFGILHGGLRYLQSLDVRRLRESVRSRRWFMQRFPDHVRPLPFLMPLYARGLKRAEVFRLAFLVDTVLTADRNRGVAAHLAPGRVLGNDAVAELFAGVRRAGLKGGALWQEAVVPDGAALFAALVSEARAAGVEIRDGMEVTGALVEGDRIAGVTARDITVRDVTGAEASFHAPCVVNAAGPWSGALAQRLDPGAPALFHPALGFNLLLDRPPPAEVGLSLLPPEGGGAMLFVYPRGGQTFAGTWYAPWSSEATAGPEPPEEQVMAFLAALNAALPGLEAGPEHVTEITAGLLPACAPGGTDLTDSDLVHDHEAHGGPKGLYSLAGIKFTTAPDVARCFLASISVVHTWSQDGTDPCPSRFGPQN